MKYFYYFVLLLISSQLSSQTNLVITNPQAEAILRGNFAPEDYVPPFPVSDPAFIAENINANVRPDSLKAYLEVMRSFRTRHTSSDTTSTTEGIGAARRWALAKFQSFSDRLITSYLQFDFLQHLNASLKLEYLHLQYLLLHCLIQ